MSNADLDMDGNKVDQESGEAKKKLEVDMKILALSACERHVVLTVPRSEIDRY